MLDNFTYPADIFPSARFYHEDLADPPVELELLNEIQHVRALETLPEPVESRLAERTIERAVLQ